PPCPPPPPPKPQPRDFLPVSAEPAESELPPPAEDVPPEPELPEPVAEELPEENYEEPVLPDYIQPVSPSLPSEWQAQEDYEKRNTSEGSLYIVASAADSAYPVPDARVTVYTRIGDRLQLNYLLVTDKSGMTPVVNLPAPPAELSQDPDNALPYAVCDIKIYANGYFREEAKDVPIFAGVTSRQEFQMIPLPLAVEEDAETIVFPSETGGVS
ncbi:MAG: hypothetical protein IKP69_03525, partial [Oscillospiraceae bacterium]|nr:hypothetical protein [Oscillospiraceae bacterium]